MVQLKAKSFSNRFAMPDNPVEVQYEPGYRLGYENGGKFYFNNHLKFVMKYHLDQDLGTYRVVGFLIETQSVDGAGVNFVEGSDTCKINSQGPQEVYKDAETNLHFTYSVQVHTDQFILFTHYSSSVGAE